MTVQDVDRGGPTLDADTQRYGKRAAVLPRSGFDHRDDRSAKPGGSVSAPSLHSDLIRQASLRSPAGF